MSCASFQVLSRERPIQSSPEEASLRRRSTSATPCVFMRGTLGGVGNESVEVHGSPFGTELFLNRFDTPGVDDSLEFVAVGEVGAYAVSVTRLGTSDITQLDTTLRIRSLKYAAHTPATADVVSDAALPQTRYLVLGSAGGLDRSIS